MLGDAPGALMLIVLVRWRGGSSPCGNPGLANTSVPRPEFSGYIPSISQMNDELFAPRSSLLARPSGPGRYIVLRMLLTAFWVPAGSPA